MVAELEWGALTLSSRDFKDLELKVPEWSTMVLWMIFQIFPFILSQEILLMAFCFGVIFFRGVRILKREIDEMAHKVAGGLRLRVPGKVYQPKQCAEELEEV